MIRKDSKISQISSYFVLFSYLVIIGSEIVHFHRIALNNNEHNFTQKTNSRSHLKFDGNDYFCSIVTAFNSISISIADFNNPFKNLTGKYESISSILQQINYKSSINYFYSLRAPPLSGAFRLNLTNYLKDYNK